MGKKSFRRVLSIILSLAMVISMFAGINFASVTVYAAEELTKVDYPYAIDMNSSGFTINTNYGAEAFQWQVSSSEDGVYTDIPDATEESYKVNNPAPNSWYRCKLDDNKVTYSVQAIKSGQNTYVFTGPQTTPVDSWYISNGTECYTVSSTGFDIRGKYTKNGISYWLNTSFNTRWEMGGSTLPEPGPLSYSNFKGTASQAVKEIIIKFLPEKKDAVLFEAHLNEGYHSFTIGADTMLGNDSITTYNDKCSLKAIYSPSGEFMQIQMVAAYSLEDALDTDPAFVLQPLTAPSTYWIGAFGARKAYTYNTSADNPSSSAATHYTYLDNDMTKPVIEVKGLDTGVNMSWMNLPDNAVIKFGFNVGDVKSTGAITRVTADVTSSSVIAKYIDDDTYYALFDPSTGDKVYDWVLGADAKNQDNQIIFDNLLSNTRYILKGVHKDNKYDNQEPNDADVSSENVITAISPLVPPAVEVLPVVYTGNKSFLIKNPPAGYVYKVKDSSNQVVAVGTTNSNGEVEINNLEQDTEYKLFANTSSNTNSDEELIKTTKLTITDIETPEYDGEEIEEGVDFVVTTDRTTAVRTYQYKSKESNGSAYIDGLPTDGGEYVVKVSLPSDEANLYLECEETFDITIDKLELGEDAIDVSGSDITYGQSLSDSILQGSVYANSEEVTGTFAWADDTIKPAVSDSDVTPYKVIFTPDDFRNFDIQEKWITITVKKAQVEKPPVDMTVYVYNGQEQTYGIASNDYYTVSNNKRTEAGTQQVTVALRDKNNYEWTDGTTSDVNYTFEINKAEQEPPVVDHTDETYKDKHDGTITEVTSDMEYRKEGENSYTAINGNVVDNLEPGIYYVRFKETNNYNASSDTQVEILPGNQITVTLPAVQVGYTLTSDKDRVDYNGSVNLEFTLIDGYDKTGSFDITSSSGVVEYVETTVGQDGRDVEHYIVKEIQEDAILSVVGVDDIIPPDVEISITTNRWTTFLNSITFGLFFNDTQTVSISATDEGTGVDKIYYYVSSDILSENDIKGLVEERWIEGTSVAISPNARCVVYGRAVDRNGNVTYVSTDGLVFDDIVPTVIVALDNRGYTTSEFAHFDEGVNVKIYVTDSSSDVEEATYRLDDGEALPINLINGVNFDVLEKGVHTIKVNVTDRAGNIMPEKYYRFAVYYPSTIDVENIGNPVYDWENIAEGVDFTIITAGSEENVVFEYKYSGTMDNLYTTGLPKNAGTYTVKATLPEDPVNFYRSASTEFDITISKATPIIAVEGSDITYGQSLQGSILTGEAKHLGEDVAGRFAWNDISIQPEVPDSNITLYDVTFIPADRVNFNEVDNKITIGVNYATQDAPVVSHTDETIKNKKDGTIGLVTPAMEYRRANEVGYTSIDGRKVTNLPAGTYYVRYKSTPNLYESPETEVVIEPGRLLNVTLPQIQRAYSLTSDKDQVEYNGSVDLVFQLEKGFNKLDSFAIRSTSGEVIYVGTYTGANGTVIDYYSVNGIKDDAIITVAGIDDISAPVIEGIENGRQYASDKTVHIKDDHIDMVIVTVNGQVVELDENDNFILPADDKDYEVIATDAVGNKTKVKVSIRKPELPSDLDEGSGKIKGEVFVDEKLPAVEVSNMSNDSAKKELSATEISNLAEEDIYHVYLDISKYASASEEDKALVRTALDRETVGMYFDVSLFKKLNEDVSYRIRESVNEYEIIMKIPDEIKNNDNNIDREYTIVRVHDGQAHALRTYSDSDMIGFKTNKFSTYAIIYKDTKKVADNVRPTEITVVPETATPVNDDKKHNKPAPVTGDNTNIWKWLWSGILSAFGLVILSRKKEEKEAEE